MELGAGLPEWLSDGMAGGRGAAEASRDDAGCQGPNCAGLLCHVKEFGLSPEGPRH